MAQVEEFKVILVGESGVGKTSFVVRFSDSKFQNAHESTVGVDCKKVRLNIDATTVELQVWDTAGQERFKSIVNRFFRSAHGAIIMYDVTSARSFEEVSWWLRETREHLTGIPIFLVGNKNDDACQHEVIDELAQDFADENRLYLYQTSARDDVNVTGVFTDLATMMVGDRKRATETDNVSDESSETRHEVHKVLLGQEATPPRKGKCCDFGDAKAHVV